MSIILKSAEDESFTVSTEGCKKSSYLQKLIDEGQTEINLDEIKSEVLESVAEYLNYYVDKDFPALPAVLKGNDLKAEINEWDFSFIDKISYDNCFRLINAGLLLELNHLYELACTKIAAFMKGKTAEQINEQFTIECQLTKEEAQTMGLETS